MAMHTLERLIKYEGKTLCSAVGLRLYCSVNSRVKSEIKALKSVYEGVKLQLSVVQHGETPSRLYYHIHCRREDELMLLTAPNLLSIFYSSE